MLKRALSPSISDFYHNINPEAYSTWTCLGRSHEAHVDAPDDTSNRADQVTTLDSLDQGVVDEGDSWPQLPARNDDAPELLQGGVPYGGEIDAGEVDTTRRGPEVSSLVERSNAGRVGGGSTQRTHEGAEEQRVEGGADGLVQRKLDERVADGEPRRRHLGAGLAALDWVSRE